MTITVIAHASPIEVPAGRRMYSELTDERYRLADQIDAWPERRPGVHTPSPSPVGQAAHVDTASARGALAWMTARPDGSTPLETVRVTASRRAADLSRKTKKGTSDHGSTEE